MLGVKLMDSSITIDDNLTQVKPRIWVQNPKSGRIPGNMGIWVAIFSEMTEFGIMFVCIFLAKVHYPEVFAAGIDKVNTLAGMLNTLALLSSSYFVAKAVFSIRQDKVDKAICWMWFSVASAGLYLIIKYWEYTWNISQGYNVDTDVFFTVYYYITFNHFLHVGWGGGALLWGIYRLKSGVYTAKEHEGLETIASYWHMIDLAWILIFPLLYVLR